MVLLLGLLLALLGLIGGKSTAETVTPAAITGSMTVIARACPAGVSEKDASADLCPIWPDGAAIQATDVNGNAWGMNAGRDSTLPGNPVVYTLDGLQLGDYVLGAPALPQGYAAYSVAGSNLVAPGNLQVRLSVVKPHADLTVYFLKKA